MIADTKRFGEQGILFEGITKTECLNYIAREKSAYKKYSNYNLKENLS